MLTPSILDFDFGTTFPPWIMNCENTVTKAFEIRITVCAAHAKNKLIIILSKSPKQWKISCAESGKSWDQKRAWCRTTTLTSTMTCNSTATAASNAPNHRAWRAASGWRGFRSRRSAPFRNPSAGRSSSTTRPPRSSRSARRWCAGSTVRRYHAAILARPTNSARRTIRRVAIRARRWRIHAIRAARNAPAARRPPPSGAVAAARANDASRRQAHPIAASGPRVDAAVTSRSAHVTMCPSKTLGCRLQVIICTILETTNTTIPLPRSR